MPDDAFRPDNDAFRLDLASLVIDGRTVLHPLDLHFRKGRVTGLLGHNGSGKSTLLKLLARQMRPSGGRILFEGAPLHTLPDRVFARRVAYMPQQSPDTDELTVRELVALGRYPWHGALGRFSRQDRSIVDQALSNTGLVDFAGRIVKTLSGGERQRAMVAMLIAQDSDFLLLDEPISALDIANQIEVMKLIRDCSEKDGKTVIVVLHDVNIAARFCDDIVALAAGRLVAQELTADLMHPPHLEAIYGVPMGIFNHPETQAPISYVL